MEWKFKEISIGDIVRVNMGSYYHYGVCTAEDRIIQFGLPILNPNENEVEVCSTDFEGFLGGKFAEVMVLNKKELKSKNSVEDIVKNNEPHVALFGGNDGMKFYDIILSNAHKVLKTPNILAFEHGYRSKEKMIELAKKYFPNSEVISIKDLSDKDRMTVVINK